MIAPQNSETTSDQDPLYHWKKHSGFKKGLLTDIVLGDEHVSKGQYSTTMKEDYVKKTISNEGKTAGRFSGFVISDKGQKHIMFGDAKMMDEERKESKVPPPQFEKVIEKGEKSIREMFHAKIPTATSSAHVGSQTRQDLPIDDNYFTLRNFNTTTNDSYRLSPEDIDKNRIIYGAKRSQLYFGDLERATNYDTVHSTSFVKHKTEPIKLKKLEYKQSAIFNSKNYDNDPTHDSHYTSTLSDAFKGVQPPANDVKYVPLKTGTSHIQFGQSKTERQTAVQSVTMKDYGKHETKSVVLRNPSYVRSHGIQTAIHPTTEPFHDYASPELLEKPIVDPIDIEPAGISFHTGSQTMSSVPEGDIRYYNTGVTKTTSKEDFISYPMAPRMNATHQEVPTKYRIFNYDSDVTSNSFETTSKNEYVEYSKADAKMVRSLPFKPSPVSNHKLGYDLGDRNLITTQHAHFTVPQNVVRRVPQLPQLAQPNKLFPLGKGNSYQTSFSEYFPPKQSTA